MNLLFATHNPNKVREFKAILKGIADVEQLEEEYVEIQSDDPEEVVKEAVQKLAEKHQKAVIAEDSGLFINALAGFPGVYSAPIHRQIGLKGILKLLEGAHDRNCSYKSAVGYCEPGKEPKSFLGVEHGKIAEEIRGTQGFGHDPIFIPEGKDYTYGEREQAATEKKFRKEAVMKLVGFLKEGA